MYETPRHSRRHQSLEPGAHGELEEFWAVEIERRNSRRDSWTALATGLAGGLAVMLLMAISLADPSGLLLPLAPVVLVAAVVAGIPSLWCVARGIRGLNDTRQLPPPPTVGGRGRPNKRDGERLERELLEVIERHGEVTPARASLETSLTIEEAEHKLSELAKQGHLEVRVEGSKLVYAM